MGGTPFTGLLLETTVQRTVSSWSGHGSTSTWCSHMTWISARCRPSALSVIQVRAQDVLPGHMEGLVVESVRQDGSLIEEGALIIVDESTSRARILPLAH